MTGMWWLAAYNGAGERGNDINPSQGFLFCFVLLLLFCWILNILSYRIRIFILDFYSEKGLQESASTLPQMHELFLQCVKNFMIKSQFIDFNLHFSNSDWSK